jgi:hypothetical protein
MKCEWVRENIVLHVYGELADDVRHELEQHVARCADCALELRAEQNFHELLTQDRAEEASPNLLASSRMRLQEALETAKQGTFWSRLPFDPMHWLQQVRFAPALAAVILILGFGAGMLTGYRVIPRTPGQISQTQITDQGPNPAIAGIDSITQDPSTSQISIKYNTVSPQQYSGQLNDQKVQELLLYAARNNNSGVRVDSVGLLAQRSSDQQVREALIYALQNDTNPGVRLKSLDALGNYVKEDTNVRDAVLRALLNDDNSGIRVEALRLIEPVKADGSVRGVLMALASKDQSTYIKSQARTMLAQLPEID